VNVGGPDVALIPAAPISSVSATESIVPLFGGDRANVGVIRESCRV
jgi:hypothetical protein